MCLEVISQRDKSKIVSFNKPQKCNTMKSPGLLLKGVQFHFQSFTICAFMMMLIRIPVWGQSPEAINYQAIARDGSGAIMQNDPVSVRIGI